MPLLNESRGKRKSGSVVQEVVGRVNDNTKRLRLIEGRQNLLTSRESSVEESVFQRFKDTNAAVEELRTQIASQNDKIALLENTVKEVVKQLRAFAPKTDLKKIEEFVKIFDPLRSEFVTRSELEEKIQEAKI